MKSSVQDNIKSKNDILEKLKEHPMCFEIRAERNKTVILFPYEVNRMGGLRVDNTAKGLKQAYGYCEKAWKGKL